MQINKLLKYLRKSKSASGFTLTELLISSFMGALVIGATGYALTNLLQGNKTATAQTNKRTEINRAMEFISDEIRRADTIDVDPAPAFNDAVPSPPTDAQPVLAINIPGVTRQGDESPIIYFLSSPRDGDKSVWKGPKVIYRFGPPLNTAGEYNLKTEVAWTVEPLVDGISDDVATDTCGNDETASPNNGALGFYACIKATNDPAKGETAKIFAIGKLDDGSVQSENYQADTQVFARAEEEVLDGKGSDNNKFDAGCNFVSGALTCPPGKKRYDVGSVADSFACKSTGEKWNVIIEYYFYDTNPDGTIITNPDGTKKETVPIAVAPGQSFTSDKQPLFRVKPDTTTCTGGFDSIQQNQEPVSSSSSTNFRQLFDGDPIQGGGNELNIDKDAYSTQTKTEDALNNKGLLTPPDSNGNTRINIDETQYVIAFEMGQEQENLPDGTPNPGFDFQDQILLIQVSDAP